MNHSTPLLVRLSIDTVRQIMESHGWTFQRKFPARTTMTFGGVVGSGGPFAKVIYDYMGKGFQIFNSALGQRDPTGDPTGVNGTSYIGVDMAGITDDNARNAKFVDEMNKVGYPPFMVTIDPDVGPSTLFINEVLLDDVQRNGIFWQANILSGYQFNGETKFGGWELLSSASMPNGSSQIMAGFYINDTNNFTIDFTFMGTPYPFVKLRPYLVWNNPNLLMVISPYMWFVGSFTKTENPEPYGPTANEVANGSENFWACMPHITPSQIDPNPTIHNKLISYCAFVSYSDRNSLNDKGATIYMNGFFKTGTRENDCGISLIPINSMYTSAGALKTQTGVALTTSSTFGMSEHDDELRIVGDLYDMYLVSKYYPVDTGFTRPEDGRQVFCFRSQQTPCEASLMCAFNPV